MNRFLVRQKKTPKKKRGGVSGQQVRGEKKGGEPHMLNQGLEAGTKLSKKSQDTEEKKKGRLQAAGKSSPGKGLCRERKTSEKRKGGG